MAAIEELHATRTMTERLELAVTRAKTALEGGAKLSSRNLWTAQQGIFRDFVAYISERFETDSEDISMSRIIQPPRTGKTVVAGYIMAEAGLMSTFIVPTKALADQAVKEFRLQLPGVPVGSFTGEDKDMVWGGVNVTTYSNLVLCFKKHKKLPPELFHSALVFVDEAHHSMTPNRMRVLHDGFDPMALRIALTATPDYDDEQRVLAQYFPDLIHEIKVGEAVELDLIAPMRTWVLEVDPQNSQVRMAVPGHSPVTIVRGDYDVMTISRQMTNAAFFEAARVCRYLPGNRELGALICCKTQTQARELEKYLVARLEPGSKPPVIVLDDTGTTRRRDIIAAYDAGRIDTIINVGVLIEGWSSERCKLLIDLDPSLSKVRAMQKFFRPMTRWGEREARIYVIIPRGLPEMPIMPVELFAPAMQKYTSGELLGSAWMREKVHSQEQKTPGIVPKMPKVAHVELRSNIVIDGRIVGAPTLTRYNRKQIRAVLNTNPSFAASSKKFVKLKKFRWMFFTHDSFIGRGGHLLQHLGVDANHKAYARFMTGLYPELAGNILLAEAGMKADRVSCFKDAKFLAESVRSQKSMIEVIEEPTVRFTRRQLRAPWRDLVSFEPISSNTKLSDYEQGVIALTGLSSEFPTPEEVASHRQLSVLISTALATLTPREEKVVRMRFGLGARPGATMSKEDAAVLAQYGLSGGQDGTLEEVGAEFEVTRERIRSIETKALRKLRDPSRSSCLRSFLR